MLILILKNVKIQASEILELVVGSSEQDTGQKGKLRTLETTYDLVSLNPTSSHKNSLERKAKKYL